MSEMSKVRTQPTVERLIQNRAGLYFNLKRGHWTAYASEATVFPTVLRAPIVPRAMGLEQVKLVTRAAQSDCLTPSN